MTDPVLGEDDELIDRLIETVNSPNEAEWPNLAFYVMASVGGQRLWAVEPDTGREPKPGSVGAERRKTAQVVSRHDYFQLLRDRLVEVTDTGVDEAFLVRSLRDDIGRHVGGLADSQAVKTSREQRREELEQHANDPDFVRGFRDRLAVSDSGVQDLSDDEVRDRLRAMADFVQPRTAEDEAAVWALNDGWTRRVGELLTDAVIDDWSKRRALRPS